MVVDVRAKAGKVRRSRKCDRGHRFTTVELLAKVRKPFNLQRARALKDYGRTYKEIAATMSCSLSLAYARLNDYEK